MATLFGAFPFLTRLFADGGCGIKGRNARAQSNEPCRLCWLRSARGRIRPKSFVVLPNRWIIERTLAWLGRCRRLTKDWECLNHKALAFLRLALRKLCNPTSKFPDRLQAWLGPSRFLSPRRGWRASLGSSCCFLIMRSGCCGHARCSRPRRRNLSREPLGVSMTILASVTATTRLSPMSSATPQRSMRLQTGGAR